MGDFVNRAARTIQSIELKKLPLTEELALRIAEETGVDEAWLYAGDPDVPPRKGMTLIQAGRGEGEYTKADYEYYRAYVETKTWSQDQWQASREKAKAEGKLAEVEELHWRKWQVLDNQADILKLLDGVLKHELALILAKSLFSDQRRLVRWKLRRYFEELAREFSLEIPKMDISIKTLELANTTAAGGTTDGKG
jgi:hypothetical protein